MFDKIVQGLWIGDKLSLVEQLSIVSWIKNGYEYHLYTYDPVEKIPEGAIIKDANEIVEKKYIFRAKETYALFADYFRAKLLQKNGGWYADLDFVLLKPLDIDDEVVLIMEDDSFFNNGLMRMPANHPISSAFLARASDPPHKYLMRGEYDRSLACKIGPGYRRLYRGAVKRKFRTEPERVAEFSELAQWGTLLGPTALTEIMHSFNGDAYILSAAQTQPIPYDQWRSVFIDNASTLLPKLEEAYTLHLWNEMITGGENFSKFDPPIVGSLFHHLLKRYDVN